MCYFHAKAKFGDEAKVILEGPNGILLSRKQPVGPPDSLFTFKNFRGHVSVDHNNNYFVATFNGVNWGQNFYFHRIHSYDDKRIVKWGCYDNDHPGFCNDYEKKWQWCYNLNNDP